MANGISGINIKSYEKTYNETKNLIEKEEFRTEVFEKGGKEYECTYNENNEVIFEKITEDTDGDGKMDNTNTTVYEYFTNNENGYKTRSMTINDNGMDGTIDNVFELKSKKYEDGTTEWIMNDERNIEDYNELYEKVLGEKPEAKKESILEKIGNWFKELFD